MGTATDTERFDTIFGDIASELQVALGQVPSVSNVFFQGSSDIINTANHTVLWRLGGTPTQTGIFQSNAVTVYASSTSALDVGTIMYVEVIDANWDKQTLGVTLNGRNPVQLAIPVRRIHYAEARNMGLNGDVYFGKGTPTLGVQTLINTLNYVHGEHNNSHQGSYTVPAGHTLLVKQFYGATNNNDEVEVFGSRSPFGATHFILGADMLFASSSEQQNIGFFAVPEKTDICFTGKSLTNIAKAHASLQGVLVKNDYFSD
jgi:hypothetical protein